MYFLLTDGGECSPQAPPSTLPHTCTFVSIDHCAPLVLSALTAVLCLLGRDCPPAASRARGRWQWDTMSDSVCTVTLVRQQSHRTVVFVVFYSSFFLANE